MDLSDIPRHAFQVAVFSSPSDMVQLRLEAVPNYLMNLLMQEKVLPAFIFSVYSHSPTSADFSLLYNPYLLPTTTGTRKPISWTRFNIPLFGFEEVPRTLGGDWSPSGPSPAAAAY